MVSSRLSWIGINLGMSKQSTHGRGSCGQEEEVVKRGSGRDWQVWGILEGGWERRFRGNHVLTSWNTDPWAHSGAQHGWVKD